MNLSWQDNSKHSIHKNKSPICHAKHLCQIQLQQKVEQGKSERSSDRFCLKNPQK